MRTDFIDMNKGVQQGCILSPLLLNRYFESIFGKALENTNQDIKVDGENINNIRYAENIETTIIIV